MRFDEFVLRVPGDEFRIRFHEHLTVLAGVGPGGAAGAGRLDRRRAHRRRPTATILTGTDHTGRPIELTALGWPGPGPLPRRRRRRRADARSAGSRPTPSRCARSSSSPPTTSGCGASTSRRDDDPPELAEARAALWLVDEERRAALDARDARRGRARRAWASSTRRSAPPRPAPPGASTPRSSPSSSGCGPRPRP